MFQPISELFVPVAEKNLNVSRVMSEGHLALDFVQGEMIDVVMAEEMRVRVHGAHEVGVFHHGEEEVLGDRSKHGFFYGHGLRSDRERERLEFDNPQVKSGDGSFF